MKTNYVAANIYGRHINCLEGFTWCQGWGSTVMVYRANPDGSRGEFIKAEEPTTWEDITMDMSKFELKRRGI